MPIYGSLIPVEKNLYASVFLVNDVGWYVLCAILSFMAGVIATVICYWFKTKDKIDN